MFSWYPNAIRGSMRMAVALDLRCAEDPWVFRRAPVYWRRTSVQTPGPVRSNVSLSGSLENV
eukprot:scaffold3354_cov369-Prasinococcus_capsulatus_cf.AAC.2